MAVPIIGNKTVSNPTPGNSTISLSHVQDVGSNRGLLVSLANGNGVPVNTATYAGVPMTKLASPLISNLSQYLTLFWLSNPPEGNNSLVITFGTTQNPVSLWSPLSVFGCSFTGCGGYGSFTYSDVLDDPTELQLNIAQNDSLIFARGQSTQSEGSIVIEGVTYSAVQMDFQHNTNTPAWGVLGTVGQSAGISDVAIDALSGDSVGQTIEIKGYFAPATIINDYYYRQRRNS